MQKWLNDLKLRLAISDNVRNSLLLEYLQVSHENIWTQYYGFQLPIDINHDWASDKTTKLATLHLAVTLFNNPDVNLEAQNVKDDRMLMRILGSRMRY